MCRTEGRRQKPEGSHPRHWGGGTVFPSRPGLRTLQALAGEREGTEAGVRICRAGLTPFSRLPSLSLSRIGEWLSKIIQGSCSMQPDTAGAGCHCSLPLALGKDEGPCFTCELWDMVPQATGDEVTQTEACARAAPLTATHLGKTSHLCPHFSPF